jgi:Tol biopolymer transport system component
MGGQERKVTDVIGVYGPLIDWSPDGEWLAFPERPSPTEPMRIVRFSLTTLKKEAVTFPSAEMGGDRDPKFSPDGRSLAFIRHPIGPSGESDIWVQPLSGGEARRLTSERYMMCERPTWMPDGNEIVYWTWSPAGIWRVGLDGTNPQLVPGLGRGALHVAIWQNRLVYTQMNQQVDMWQLPGRKAPRAKRIPQRMSSVMTSAEGNVAFSPDGRKIAFRSDRSGAHNIWISNSDGSSPVQLTNFRNATETPRWSPDGKRIVFGGFDSGNWSIYVIDAEGGIPRCLTPEATNESWPNWSRDGRWVYFSSYRSSSVQIWKQPAEGGTAVQVTKNGGWYGEESYDGRYLYYSKTHSGSGIWRVPVEGGEEIEVIRAPIHSGLWELSADGIYYALNEGISGGVRKQTIYFYDFQSRQTTELYVSKGPDSIQSIAVSPDEHWILFTALQPATSELVLVENFR